MKRLYLLWALSSLAATSQAEESLEGYWKNERSGVTIKLEETTDGFRTKRTDQNNWYYYQKIRYEEYEDYAGNRITLVNNFMLDWESNDGQRKLRFVKAEGDQSYQNDRNNSDRERNGYRNIPDSESYYDVVPANRLSGKWKNRYTGLMIRIKDKRNHIEVRDNYRGRWIQFRKSQDGSFKDKDGNRYYLQRGMVTFESRYGDYIIRFRKS